MQNLETLTFKELEKIEQEVYADASKVWDQICWELDKFEKSRLIAKLKELGEYSQAIYAARAELYSR